MTLRNLKESINTLTRTGVEDKHLHTWILGGGTTTNAVTIFDSKVASLEAKKKEEDLCDIVVAVIGHCCSM